MIAGGGKNRFPLWIDAVDNGLGEGHVLIRVRGGRFCVNARLGNPLFHHIPAHSLPFRHGFIPSLPTGRDQQGFFARPLLLRNYIHQADDTSSISAHPVNAMYVEPDGTLWVGTVEGGLNCKAVGSHAFEHFTTQNSGLSHNSVSALEADTHGQLWVATWGGGLNKVNLSSKKVEHVELPADMTPITNYIGALAYDKYNDALWIGSNDGVFYYDLKTGTVTDPFDGNRLTRGCIGSLIDTEGQLWMGCITWHPLAGLQWLRTLSAHHRRNGQRNIRELDYQRRTCQ